MITNKVKGLLGKFYLSLRSRRKREGESSQGKWYRRANLACSELVDFLIPMRTIRAIRGKGCPDKNWKCFCQLEGLADFVHVLEIRLGLKATLCYYNVTVF